MKRTKKLWIALLCLTLLIGITAGCTSEPEAKTTEPTETTVPTEPSETTEPTEASQKTDFMDSTVETYFQEGEYRIPKLNMDSAYGDFINSEIQARYKDLEKYRKIDYFWAKHDTILSLVICYDAKEGDQSYEGIKSYNINLLTGGELTKEEILGDNLFWERDSNRELSIQFAKDLYERYVQTGMLAYDAKTDMYFLANIHQTPNGIPVPKWVDSTGVRWVSGMYQSPDGELTYKSVALNQAKTYEETPISELKYEEISFPTPTDEYFTDEYILRIPFLLMPGERVAEINGELLRAYHSRYVSVEYSVVENGDIISIVANGEHAEMPFDTPYVYNISKSTGLDVPTEEVYAAGGLDAQSYADRIKDVMLNACIEDFPENYKDLEFIPTIIEETLSDENLARCIPYLDENGKLWVKANIYQVAGAECLEHLLPVTDAVFVEEYYNYLASQ